jgi:hypothetical protein
MIEIIISLDKLINCNNVSIKTHKLKKENEIIKSYSPFTSNRSFYINLIKLNNKYIITYSQNTLNYYNSNVIYLESDDGINFSEPKKFFYDFAAGHNFHIFKDSNPNIPDTEKIKILGGIAHSKRHVIINSIDLKNNLFNTLDNPSQEFEVYKSNIYPLLDDLKVMELPTHKSIEKDGYGKCWIHPDQNSKLRNNGIYLYKYTNKSDIKYNNFELIYNRPIINGIKPICFETRNPLAKNPLNQMDSSISCFYDNNFKKYILYIRANISMGGRSIQYTLSDDMKNWSDFELINFIPNWKDKDSYYSPEISQYPDTNLYIGFPGYFKENNKINMKTKLIISNNAKDFYIHDYIIDENYNNYCSQKFFLINDVFHFYIFENPFKKNIKLTRYSIDKDRLLSITCGKNIGEFTTKYLLNIENNQIIINFKTYDNGYIKFELLDSNKLLYKNYSFKNCEILDGDYSYKKIIWNNTNNIIDIDKVYVKCIMYNCDLFTISGHFDYN